MKTRVVLVDDHVSIRQMLAACFRREGDFEVVGEATTGLEALEVCRAQAPQLVIVDLALPELCGGEVVRRLRKELPNIRILIYSGVIERPRLLRALRSGADGFVQKSDSLDILLDAMQVIARGGVYLTDFAKEALNSARPADTVSLSDREREVLQLVAESRSSKEIAARLGISARTVEHHRARIMEKLSLDNVAALTRYAVQNGYIGVS